MIELTDQEKEDVFRLAEHPFFKGERAGKAKSTMELLIEHYFKEGKSKEGFMTYLIHSPLSGLYKIGRAKNVKNRLNFILSFNPSSVILWKYDCDIERALHIRFHGKRKFREWFELSSQDVKEIKRIK